MPMNTILLIRDMSWTISVILIIYLMYYVFIAFFSLKKLKPIPNCEPRNKFAIIIAARNEAKVIGNLVNSLKLQNYPAELFDILVIPNNCTDDTEAVALQSGAKIIECTVPVRSKGQVLAFTFDYISEHFDPYDAFCIIDADNLVEGDFLRQMNNALCAGAQVAQGYRDSKNATDSIVSSWHSIYYWTINRLYNQARNALGLSAIINGTGFMVSSEVLKKLGGWNTVTMTEDIEFTSLCAINDIKVHWVPKAIIFDEQPITFLQSWNQRKRWSTGILQCLYHYTVPLFKAGFRLRNFRCMDIMLLLWAPIFQTLSLVSFVLILTLTAFGSRYDLFPQTDVYFRMFVSLDGSVITAALLSLLVVLLEKKNARKMLKGIITTWIFVASWIPINIICLFHRSEKWHEIEHTRSLDLSDMSQREDK